MNLFDDKNIYRILALILGTICTSILIAAYFSGGLKILLFAAWFVFVCTLFSIMVFYAIQAATVSAARPNKSNQGIGDISSGSLNVLTAKILLMFVFILLFFLTALVWNIIDSRFPDATGVADASHRSVVLPEDGAGP